MRRLRVDHVIELAMGLFGLSEAQILRPTVGMQSVVRDAAVKVAHLHCGKPVEIIAGNFLMSIADAEHAISFGDEMLADRFERSAYSWRADLLHRYVVRLKAAWRREAEMARWRAAQEPVPHVHSRWQPRSTKENVELTRSRIREQRSIWGEQEAAQ